MLDRVAFYECAQEGHLLRHQGEPHPETIVCWACGSRATRTDFRPAQVLGCLRPEITPHHNLSFGRTVYTRKHLEHLQAKHGTTDYSPASHQPVPTWFDSGKTPTGLGG